MYHINTIRAVNRKSSSSCNKSDNLISWYRITASGKPDCHIINSFYDNSTLGLGNMDFILSRLCNFFKYNFICQFLLVILAIFFRQTIHDLSFF